MSGTEITTPSEHQRPERAGDPVAAAAADRLRAEAQQPMPRTDSLPTTPWNAATGVMEFPDPYPRSPQPSERAAGQPPAAGAQPTERTGSAGAPSAAAAPESPSAGDRLVGFASDASTHLDLSRTAAQTTLRGASTAEALRQVAGATRMVLNGAVPVAALAFSVAEMYPDLSQGRILHAAATLTEIGLGTSAAGLGVAGCAESGPLGSLACGSVSYLATRAAARPGLQGLASRWER